MVDKSLSCWGVLRASAINTESSTVNCFINNAGSLEGHGSGITTAGDHEMRDHILQNRDGLDRPAVCSNGCLMFLTYASENWLSWLG